MRVLARLRCKIFGHTNLVCAVLQFPQLDGQQHVHACTACYATPKNEWEPLIATETNAFIDMGMSVDDQAKTFLN
jgi:hypothetical protein